MTDNNEDSQKGLATLRQLVSELNGEDSAFLLARIETEEDTDSEFYRVMTLNMDSDALINTAIVALTSLGQTIIDEKQERDKYEDEENMQTAAFFYGLKVLSQSTSQWAKEVAERFAGGPKHVRDDITDSASADDKPTPPRSTGGGDPIH